MLFSKTVSEKWESVRNCRPYLLTLLNHHMNWSSLECALDILLELSNVEKLVPNYELLLHNFCYKQKYYIFVFNLLQK